MDITCGIVGLPNVGKSTLFNALTGAHADVANYPFCTIDPNVSVVPVPDERLEQLARIYNPAKVTPTVLEFVDIAGLVRGASRGEGLGNQFLHHIRNVDAILHVVRCFEDQDVSHIAGSIDPHRDIEIVETELLLKDLETVEKKIEAVAKKSKSGEKKLKEELALYERLRQHIAAGRYARRFSCAPNERQYIDQLFLLTSKPVLYIANVGEKEYLEGNGRIQVIRDVAQTENAPVIPICSKLEAEIAQLSKAEQKEFLRDLGIEESGLTRVIHEAYALLDLITFFTGNPNELRAWSIKRGSTAYDAAGKIHSDFQKGFIRAEVYKTKDLLDYGSETTLRERGAVAIHGKEYVVEDGDVIYFRFNV